MNRKNAFTLIELLVVIAVIALLMSILVPALAKAKNYVEDVICKNNLRQYMMATNMYSLDNKDYIPDPWQSLYNSCQGRCQGFCQNGSHITFQGEIERYCRWHNAQYDLQTHPDYGGAYWNYLGGRAGSSKINTCPTFKRLAKQLGMYHQSHNTSIPVGEVVTFGYSMNYIFRQEISGKCIPVRKSQVVNPSRTFLWAEENMWPIKSENLTTTYSGYVLNDTALCAEYGRDSFASFHKISTNKLNAQRPDAGGTGYGKYNGGVGHVLMLDGQILQLTPADSPNYAGKIK